MEEYRTPVDDLSEPLRTPPKIRTIVVDHDKLTQARLCKLLEPEPDIDLLGIYTTSRDAQAVIGHAPDLVFLEARLRAEDGIRLARTLIPANPAIVFVSACRDSAVRAFELRAVDYVLKPFSDERLRAALVHARRHLGRRDVDMRRRELSLPSSPSPAPSRRHLIVRSDGRIRLVRTRDIESCEAVGNYVRIHTGAETYLMRSTLAHMEAQLDRRLFVRVHRSTIVNMDCVHELRASSRGEYAILLRNQRQVTLSRGYRDVFEQALGQSL